MCHHGPAAFAEYLEMQVVDPPVLVVDVVALLCELGSSQHCDVLSIDTVRSSDRDVL